MTSDLRHDPGVRAVEAALIAAPLIPTLFRPYAILRRADTGRPVAGRVVTFSVGGHPVCCATTDEDGVAWCPQNLVVAIGSYDVTTEATEELRAGSARGSLL